MCSKSQYWHATWCLSGVLKTLVRGLLSLFWDPPTGKPLRSILGNSQYLDTLVPQAAPYKLQCWTEILLLSSSREKMGGWGFITVAPTMFGGGKPLAGEWRLSQIFLLGLNIVGFTLSWLKTQECFSLFLDLSQKHLFSLLLNPCLHGRRRGRGIPSLSSSWHGAHPHFFISGASNMIFRND